MPQDTNISQQKNNFNVFAIKNFSVFVSGKTKCNSLVNPDPYGHDYQYDKLKAPKSVLFWVLAKKLR